MKVTLLVQCSALNLAMMMALTSASLSALDLEQK